MVARRMFAMPLKTLLLTALVSVGVMAQAEAAPAEPAAVTMLRAHTTARTRPNDDAGDVVFRSDRVYVLDAANLRIQIHQADARYLVTIPLNTLSSNPTNLVVDNRNYLWILDDNSRVVQLDDQGHLVTTYYLD